MSAQGQDVTHLGRLCVVRGGHFTGFWVQWKYPQIAVHDLVIGQTSLACCATASFLGLGKRWLGAACSGNKQAGRHRLHTRDSALLTDLMYGKQHPSCRGVTPEPIRQRRTVDGTVPWLRCEGFAVVGFEVFHRVSEEGGQGDICTWIGWRLAIEESADERPHLLWRQPADPYRGTAASGHREIVPRVKLSHLALQGRPQAVS